MSDDKKKTDKAKIGYVIRSTYILFLILFVIMASNDFIETRTIDSSMVLTFFLVVITFSYYLSTNDTLNFEKTKSDIELKQKQLELFYYPFLQLIDKCKNPSEIPKEDINSFYKYQHFTLDSPLKQTFLELEDGTYEGTVNEFKEFKKEVKKEICRIESELNDLYKNEVKILDKGPEAVRNAQGSGNVRGNFMAWYGKFINKKCIITLVVYFIIILCLFIYLPSSIGTTFPIILMILTLHIFYQICIYERGKKMSSVDIVLLTILAIVILGLSMSLVEDSMPTASDVTDLAITALLLIITLFYTSFTKDTLEHEKTKSDIEYNQKQLDLFYRPLLQMIEDPQNYSGNLEKELKLLCSYQYLILHNDKNKDDNELTKFFSKPEEITNNKFSDKLEGLKEDVINDIRTINNDLRNHYDQAKILDKGSEAVKEVQRSKEEEGNGNL